MSRGVVERDGMLWVPILPKEFLDRLVGLGLDRDVKRRDEWPKAVREDYDRLRSEFTKAKAEFASWVRKDRNSLMTPTAKTVVIVLLDCLNFDTGRCDPSHQYIADEIGISRRQVERLMPSIAKAGWIDVRRRGRTATNAYRFRVSAEKVMAIIDYMDHLRECRTDAREEKRNSAFQQSDPTPMSDQGSSDPTSVRSHDPTSMSVRDPTPMSDKPLKGTTEEEHLNKEEPPLKGMALRTCVREETAFEAPPSLEIGKRFLVTLGCPRHRMEAGLQRLMREALYPSTIGEWKREAEGEGNATAA